MIIRPKNNNLNYLMDRTFRCFNILFVLLFARTILGDKRDSFSHYYLPNVEIKDSNVLIYGKGFFDLLIKNEEATYEKIVKMSNNNDYTTGNLLDLAYFKKKKKITN